MELCLLLLPKSASSWGSSTTMGMEVSAPPYLTGLWGGLVPHGKAAEGFSQLRPETHGPRKAH